MNQWHGVCDCCEQDLKIIRGDDGSTSRYNTDDTPHEKHPKIWVSKLASFELYGQTPEELDPDIKIGDMTYRQLEQMIESRINFKLGQYYHGQSGYKEKWLKPRRFTCQGVNYYVAGTIDGEENGRVVELKTTWATKARMDRIIEGAKIQADGYAWIAGYKEAKIIVKNLLRPELDDVALYVTRPGRIDDMLVRYVHANKNTIKRY